MAKFSPVPLLGSLLQAVDTFPGRIEIVPVVSVRFKLVSKTDTTRTRPFAIAMDELAPHA